MAGADVAVVITGERRLAALSLAERLGALGVRAEVRPPVRIEGQVPARRPVAILASAWSAGLAQFVRRLHARGHHAILLALPGAEVDRLGAMRAGAADVIGEGPEQAEELALKLRRLSELAPGPGGPKPAAAARPGERVYRLGGYSFDPVRQHLTAAAGGAVISLTPTESVVLYCLVRAAAADPQRRMRVPDLIAACRLPGLTPAALRKHVFELRSKLERTATLPLITGDLRMGLSCNATFLDPNADATESHA